MTAKPGASNVAVSVTGSTMGPTMSIPPTPAIDPATLVVHHDMEMELTVTALAALLPLLRSLSERARREPDAQPAEIAAVPSKAS